MFNEKSDDFVILKKNLVVKEVYFVELSLFQEIAKKIQVSEDSLTKVS